nr:MAG TPA: hypothetical protein [Caudoviricetes sp.]
MNKIKIYAHIFLIVIYLMLTCINIKGITKFYGNSIAISLLIAEQMISTLLVILCIILMNRKEW